ncbi:hypothetical protein [Staphylococcus caprae]|uniref:hypothetical protein n=1 Tax=Staphylococcus caprae TaxID=29380 RepID=UPI003B21AFC7
MPKIKVEKQMTLPELIEWAWKNGIREKTYHSSTDEFVTVNFDVLGHLRLSESIAQLEKFVVEVEEEINKYTALPGLVVKYKRGSKTFFVMQKDISVNDVLQEGKLIYDATAKSINLINDDDTMTLLWRNGEMVE